MSHNHFDEKSIEELLNNAPKIEDHRSKEDVLARLKDEGVFDEKPTVRKQRKSPKWMPYIVLAAAVALFSLILPSMFKNMDEFSEQKESKEEVKSDLDVQNSTASDSSSSDEVNEAADIATTEGEVQTTSSIQTAVYDEDLTGFTPFTIGLVSQDADSIPITFLIPNDKILEDFGHLAVSQLELYNAYAGQIDEEALGYTEYHPYVGHFEEQDQKLIHYLPQEHSYDITSAALSIYESSLIDTFANYQSIEFLHEDHTPVYFDGIGDIMTLPTKGENTQYNYFRYEKSDGMSVLAPNFRATFQSVEEALSAMKENSNDIYQSVIIDGINYSIEVNGDVVIIRFNDLLQLEQYEEMQAMQMLEGMLLTAKSFGKQVKIENIAPKNWQGFDFPNPLPMPIGANKLMFK